MSKHSKGGEDTTNKGKSTQRTRREQKEPPQANKQRKEQREAQRKKIENERNKRGWRENCIIFADASQNHLILQYNDELGRCPLNLKFVPR